jgi:hypothetical protein
LLLGSILTWLGMWCQPFLKEILRDWFTATNHISVHLLSTYLYIYN